MWPFPLSVGRPIGNLCLPDKKEEFGKKYCQGVLKLKRNDFQLFCVFDAMERLKKAGNVGFIFGILLLHTSTSGKPFFATEVGFLLSVEEVKRGGGDLGSVASCLRPTQ